MADDAGLPARVAKLRTLIVETDLDRLDDAVAQRVKALRVRAASSRTEANAFTQWQDRAPAWDNHYNFRNFDDFSDCW